MKKLIAITIMCSTMAASIFAGPTKTVEGSLITIKTGILATVIPIKVIEIANENEDGKEYLFINNGLGYEDCIDGVFGIKQVKSNEKDGYDAYKIISNSCD
jgi:hypothetical protein